MNNASLPSDLFFALSDPTRIAIVSRLKSYGASSATLLAKDAQVTRQNIVKHLHVLELCGLAKRDKRGREVLYSLEPARLSEARDFLQELSVGWDSAIERLRQNVEIAPR